MGKRLAVAILLMSLGAYVISADLPDSKKSKNIIKKTVPKLEKALALKKLILGQPIFIRIFKDESILEVWVKKKSTFHLFKKYPILAYSGTLGPKLKEGDKQSPEGFYYVTPSRLNPKSRFHLSFNLGFPNKYDRSHKRTGSALMVHGSNVSIGCYAMGDKAIEEIYTMSHMALRNGQKYFRVHIFPFHMSKERMKKEQSSKWSSFWKNLKEGYDWFEEKRTPPNVEVLNKKYFFTKS